MKKRNQQTVSGQAAHEVPSESELFAPEVPSESELFVDQVNDGLSERQIFVGSEDFYNSLADSVRPPVAQKPVGPGQIEITPVPRKSFSNIQKILVVNIVLVAAMLLYPLLRPSPKPAAVLAPTTVDKQVSAVQQTAPAEPPVADSAKAAQKQIQKPEPQLPPAQPLSLKVAQDFYLKGDYKNAYAVYSQLHQSLSTNPKEQLLSDFFQLRMALCMKATDDFEQANHLLKRVSKSPSPVVSVIANYHRSLLEMQKNQYLNARTRAYQTIALIDAAGFEADFALSLKRDCRFLAAEALTRKVLLLCDADRGLPEDLWSRYDNWHDPFTALNETQLRSFLKSGSEHLSKAILGPQIQELKRQSGSPRYLIICHRAPVEELLFRLAANAGLDVHWALGPDKTVVRKRPVNLYLQAATAQQLVTVAAGCASLLARLDEKSVVNIFDPVEYSYISEQISLLAAEAISLWQKFLFKFHNDPSLPNIHFALALLQAQKGRIPESIAEYKLVANRFSRSSLAPFALLNSSKLKTSLRDYDGAREDLKQLVEIHREAEIAEQAYLYLADTTAKATLKAEAARLYRKLYNLSSSLELQTAAALGAGRYSYEVEDYEAAAKWLIRYISLAKDHKNEDSSLAYFLLGKTNITLGKIEEACDALQYALQSQLSDERHLEAVSALVKAYIKQGYFTEALEVLDKAYSAAASQAESIEILMLKSRVLRAMGLLDKAVATLGDRDEYITDPQLKTKVFFELAHCYIAKGNMELARKKLTQILVMVEPGSLAYKAALELADVCLKLGQDSQTVSICSQLLDLDPPEQIKQKALDLLATAYDRQKNYDRAALALLGHWK